MENLTHSVIITKDSEGGSLANVVITSFLMKKWVKPRLFQSTGIRI